MREAFLCLLSFFHGDDDEDGGGGGGLTHFSMEGGEEGCLSRGFPGGEVCTVAECGVSESSSSRSSTF